MQGIYIIKKLSLLLIGIVTCSGAFADTTPSTGDKTTTSKTYVTNQLATKQNKIGAGTNGSVVTYTGTAGSVGQKAVYNESATYNSAALVEAGQVNTAIQNGINGHVTCASLDPTDNTTCLLWQINSATGTHFNHN